MITAERIAQIIYDEIGREEQCYIDGNNLGGLTVDGPLDLLQIAEAILAALKEDAP
jgi:hypothetical protein